MRRFYVWNKYAKSQVLTNVAQCSVTYNYQFIIPHSNSSIWLVFVWHISMSWINSFLLSFQSFAIAMRKRIWLTFQFTAIHITVQHKLQSTKTAMLWICLHFILLHVSHVIANIWQLLLVFSCGNSFFAHDLSPSQLHWQNYIYQLEKCIGEAIEANGSTGRTDGIS